MKSILHLLIATASALPAAAGATEQRPNVLIFLLDDVGYGQLGAFGGPIRTPNIDRVAKMGLRYTNHHTAALCSPSRAALLTGRNHHSVGFGVIAEIATAEPGYTGRFPDDKLPLVQAFREQGYKTAAFGKWHNTPVNQIGAGVAHDQLPRDLGFDRFYGFLGGDMSQYEPLMYDNEIPVQANSGISDYHLTNDMTDKTISWLDNWKAAGDHKPFFAFYATGAAHAPHHAPPEYINRYIGEFDKGWDRVREETFARQKAMGLFPEVAKLTPRTKEIAAWNDLSKNEKRLYARMQEIFAGFVEHTDAQFGRLLQKLESMGELENTIIIITSDNGASGEGGLAGSFNETLFFNALPESLEENLARIDSLGTKESFNHYPAGWALAGNTPFQFFKQTSHEGGVADPFIIAWKDRIKDEGALRHQYIHISDVLPTVMEAADIDIPERVNGVEQKPIEGVSFAQTLHNPSAPTNKKIQYYEMLGNRGLWLDGWKAVTFHGRLPWDSAFTSAPFEDDKWELYNLNLDPTEATDLAGQYPKKLAEMKQLWQQEAEKYLVFPLDDSTAARILTTRKRFVGDRTVFSYTGTDKALSPAVTASTIGNSHTISARVSPRAGGGDGVIVASGGRFGGFALFVKDQRLHYTYNYVGLEQYEISSSEPLPSGPLAISALFSIKDDKTAEVALSVNGESVVSGLVKRLTPITYGTADTFDVGSDLSTPVSDRYVSPFDYDGVVEDVTFRILE